MPGTWRERVTEQLEDLDPGWPGLWSLLSMTSHAAFTLSLVQPLGSAVDLAFAALDLGEAREELEWIRPALAGRPTIRLGALTSSDDLDAARATLEELVAAAIERVFALEDDGSRGEVDALGRVLRRLNDAARQFARAAA